MLYVLHIYFNFKLQYNIFNISIIILKIVIYIFFSLLNVFIMPYCLIYVYSNLFILLFTYFFHNYYICY